MSARQAGRLRHEGGGDGLAQVPLRVFRDVYQQPEHGRRQTLAPHPARLGKRRRIDGVDGLLGAPQRASMSASSSLRVAPGSISAASAAICAASNERPSR